MNKFRTLLARQPGRVGRFTGPDASNGRLRGFGILPSKSTSRGNSLLFTAVCTTGVTDGSMLVTNFKDTLTAFSLRTLLSHPGFCLCFNSPDTLAFRREPRRKP